MSKATFLAHKHTLYESFSGFFRALASEKFSDVRDWLHPELEQLIFKQCERLGEAAFLRSLRQGLGSANQRVRLGSSKAEGARKIRTELRGPEGNQAGTVCFVLSTDGWRIYSVEIWSNSASSKPKAPVVRTRGSASSSAWPKAVKSRKKKGSKLPKILSKDWLKTICTSS